jgi:hypothetical protein
LLINGEIGQTGPVGKNNPAKQMRDIRKAAAGVGKLAGCQRPTKSPNNNANGF